jgi:molybdenum cofactor synthesis domain-containing protein
MGSMDAAVVTVGDELLSGDTENTNATWVCRELTRRGVDVERVTTVPDRVPDIARVVNEYRAEYDAVVVTGGLGPTHDDVTMDGVAAAVDREVERHLEALSWLTDEGGYEREDLVEGTADIPAGARPLHNEVGVAPGAVVDSIYVLPGVPTEMKAMFETIADDFTGEVDHHSVVVVDEPESALLDRIDALRDRFDVGVGSYPGEYVEVRIRGTDEPEVERAADWLREQVDLVEE